MEAASGTAVLVGGFTGEQGPKRDNGSVAV